jgi:DNA-directed RNA polymerase specialized sigma24 family protein
VHPRIELFNDAAHIRGLSSGLVLQQKPDWADMFIAIRIDGEPIRHYAARNGVSENSITQKLKRAVKKLKENFENRQI